MGPYRCLPIASDEEDALVSMSSNESLDFQAPLFCVPRPGHLSALVSELTLAFTEAKALGAVLNNRQDIASFSRLNGRVYALLKAYGLTNCGDWRRYAVWGDHGYLRHLLCATDEFELMVLCWKAGQASRVHNHADSHCWLAVLDGEVREMQYRPITLEDAAPCQTSGDNAGGAVVVEARLEPTTTTDMHVGDVAYINDHIALHAVGCFAHDASEDRVSCGAAPSLACTLHLYCPPIRRVKAIEAGRVTECVPGFFSRHSL